MKAKTAKANNGHIIEKTQRMLFFEYETISERWKLFDNFAMISLSIADECMKQYKPTRLLSSNSLKWDLFWRGMSLVNGI